MSDPQRSFAMCAVFGVSGLFCGAFVQHEVSLMHLFDAIKRDPYVYLHRHRFYSIFSTFSTDHEGRLWNRATGLKDKLCQELGPRLYNALLGKPLEVEENASSVANMLDLIKYGLPSAEGLLVHRHCIMSQSKEMSSAKWIIEHFRWTDRGEAEAEAEESGNGSDLQRYKDVFLLGNDDGSAAMGKVFKRRIWHELEQYVTAKTRECGSVYTYTGPIYMPMGDGQMWWLECKKLDTTAPPIPTHYFKVLIMESQLSETETETETETENRPTLEAYIIKNGGRGAGSFRNHRHRIEDIERYTGLSFSKDLQPAVLHDESNGTIHIDLAGINDVPSLAAG
ncbi:endonuclease G, mitochondrial-like [Drosophila subobscura]|uniref:endonuclease G, mitochondrial-like n=1 Tax=Drosophila subobscura TaxID=7241 RepID=UPI00155A4524|nr:endonuclease G, mitochondrial-like [Drosophila subobscura]